MAANTKNTTKRFPNSTAASFLYRLGVAYHDYGVIKNAKGEKLFDYYKVDKLTEEQKAGIVLACPDVQFKISSPSYAPEIKHGLICFPKAAFYRNKRRTEHD